MYVAIVRRRGIIDVAGLLVAPELSAFLLHVREFGAEPKISSDLGKCHSGIPLKADIKRSELSYSAFASELRADGGKSGAYSSCRRKESSFRRPVQPFEKLRIAFVTSGSMVDGAMARKGAWPGAGRGGASPVARASARLQGREVWSGVR
jgi:hypothetical protein